MNIKKPNSFARYGNDYVAPLTTIDQIVKPSGERYTDKEFELMSNVENVMFGENCAGKNLLNPTLQTTTINGVTCTNNGDGTYTLNGTASDNATFYLLPRDGTKHIGNGKYCLTGCIGGSNTTFYIQYQGRNKDDTTNIVDSRCTDRTTNPFEITDDVKLDFFIIRVFSGVTLNNTIVKPMITTDLNATYDDFEPYVKSLRQLTDSALNMDLLWTNASPTSAFAPQTINLDLSGYKCIVFNVAGDTTNFKAQQNLFVFSKTIDVTVRLYAFTTILCRRLITITNSGIVFQDGAYPPEYNKSFNSDANAVVIPLQIYGVK